jgi:tetratricopeptide (TPR) repeat protein
MTLRQKAVVLALVAAPILLAGCSSIRAKAAFQDGNKAYLAENYKQAIGLYENAVKYDPNMAEAWFYLANSNQALYRPNKKDLKTGEPDVENRKYLETALQQYQKALEVNKGRSENLKKIKANTLAVLVQIYSDDPYKNYEQATGYAQELVKDDPDKVQNLFALGALYEKFERISEAEQAYRKAVEREPANVKTWNALATYYNKPYWDGRSRFDDAIKALEKAAELAPDDPVGYYKIATFYWDKAFRDPMLQDAEKLAYAEKGLAAADRALSINPDYCDALIYKGLLLRVKAQVASNPRQRAKMLDEADAVRKLAVECKKSATDAQAAASAGSAAPTAEQ